MQDLHEIYDALASPSGSADLYTARALDGRPSYRVGRDPMGNPAVLISPSAPDGPAPSSVELRNLSFRPRCSCRIVQPDGVVRTESLAVLRCLSGDPLLHEYFLRVLAGAIKSLPLAPTESEVGAAVMRLVELFQALDAPPRGSLQGTWCELLLIASATRVRQAVAAWHAHPGARHDFSAGRQRLEVKSTIGPLRTHHFSLEQLRCSDGAQVVVASFILEEDPRGPSIRDLWNQVAERPELSDDGRDRVARILALALGRDWREATTMSFNVDQALACLRIYDADQVPSVSSDLPPTVSDVRFQAELTDVPHLSRTVICRRGGLMEAMFDP